MQFQQIYIKNIKFYMKWKLFLRKKYLRNILTLSVYKFEMFLNKTERNLLYSLKSISKFLYF